jgi:hypothetical protein
MNNRIFLIVVIILVVALGIFMTTRKGSDSTQLNKGKLPISDSPIPQKDDLIRVTSIKNNQTITSPVTITGEARGTWFFEASFPVRIEDAQGKVLAQGPAAAQGEWMTENYVPFSIIFNFVKPESGTGYIILEKDNPSGLPENANELRVPIQF